MVSKWDFLKKTHFDLEAEPMRKMQDLFWYDLESS